MPASIICVKVTRAEGVTADDLRHLDFLSTPISYLR
jgi:hypothetical protein